MNLAAALAVVSLIERIAGATKALQGVGDVIKAKAERGEEITLDDLKMYELSDDKAREALVQAIEDAENT